MGDDANFYLHLMFMTLAPLFFLGILGVNYLINKGAVAEKGRLQVFKSNHQAYCVLVAFVMLPATSKTIFRTYVCESFDDGFLKLQADFSLDCSSPRHIFMQLYASIMLCIWPIGMPLCFYILLYSNKNDIQRDEHYNARTVDPVKELKSKPLIDGEFFANIRPSRSFGSFRNSARSVKSAADRNEAPSSPSSAAAASSSDSEDDNSVSSDDDAIRSEELRRSRPSINGPVRQSNMSALESSSNRRSSAHQRLGPEQHRSTLKLLSMHIRDYLEDEETDMIDLFDKWDRDKNHSLDKTELREALFTIKLTADDIELDRYYQVLDADGDGFVQLDDFIISIDFNFNKNPRLRGFTMLYQSYNPERFYWELVVTFRRIIITGALVVMDQGSVEQNVAGIVVQFVSVVLQSIYHPYNSNSANHTSLVCEVALFFALFGGLVMAYRDNGELSSGVEEIIGLSLTFMFGIVMCTACFSTVKEIVHDFLFDDIKSIRDIKRAGRKGRRQLVVKSAFFGIGSGGNNKVVPVMSEAQVQPTSMVATAAFHQVRMLI